MTNAPCAPPAAGRGSAAGFSLIETLIAAFIILMVFIGVLPLFTRAMANNVQGNDASRMTNATVDGFETLLGLPFNSQLTNLTAGTMLQRTDIFLRDANIWAPDLTSYPTDQAQYTRIAEIEQFSVQDLDEDDVLDDPLDASTSRDFVHLKRFEFTIQDARWNPGLSGTRAYQVVTVQGF